MRERGLICVAFAWVCSFCKGKQSFRLSSLIYKWNCHVSTHGSRRGSRQTVMAAAEKTQKFQLTAPSRGADSDLRIFQSSVNVSTHGSLRGSRPKLHTRLIESYQFQLTAPSGGADVLMQFQSLQFPRFQLTAPARGADRDTAAVP